VERLKESFEHVCLQPRANRDAESVASQVSICAYKSFKALNSRNRPDNNISNDNRRCQESGFCVFLTWRHTCPDSVMRTDSRAMIFFSDLFIQPHGSGPFLHRCGGAAHQTSLRSPSITMCYSNSPPVLGRRVAYSVDPITALQDHVVTQAYPHGLSPPAATVRGGRTLRNQSGRAA